MDVRGAFCCLFYHNNSVFRALGSEQLSLGFPLFPGNRFCCNLTRFWINDEGGGTVSVEVNFFNRKSIGYVRNAEPTFVKTRTLSRRYHTGICSAS